MTTITIYFMIFYAERKEKNTSEKISVDVQTITNIRNKTNIYE
jgi:hypothetical protein